MESQELRAGVVLRVEGVGSGTRFQCGEKGEGWSEVMGVSGLLDILD